MSVSEELNSRSGGLSNRAPKRRKTRTTFTSFQLAELEVYFSKQKYLTPTDRDQIASELGLSSTQVSFAFDKHISTGFYLKIDILFTWALV